MWEIKIFGFEFFYIFYNFIFYSFFGWIYESTLVSVRNKKFINRGFMNGPVIPIYGVGATVVYVVFLPLRDNIAIIFFGGLILATVIEYITSYAMEKIFHAKWWDYSYLKYNIKGRVCLRVSLFWGVLSVAMTYFMQPIISEIIKRIPKNYGENIGYAIFGLFFLDFAITFISTLKLDRRIADIQKLRQELTEYIENTRIYETKEEIRIRFENFRITEMIDNIKLKLENEIMKHKDNTSSMDSYDFMARKIETETKIREILGKYQKKRDFHIIHKRLLRAFPGLKIKGRELALKDFKDKMHQENNMRNIEEEPGGSDFNE
ncbi:putative ABC transporter permease [Anaeromicropila herbilytica]|uniref:Membrane protein n=1 Tax=Anaeromicropila herbilytica TaxID=2785025 RepID=A0A7R7EKN2_9FIRM|nr:putative ABC transporter permease [Anaeromicropila herbilytica]BCN30494.1 membrane protein [Anaeromicropila herbilytica]